MKIPNDMKEKLTPEFFEFWCKYAEGFNIINKYLLCYDENAYYSSDILELGGYKLFPLFIHRACDGFCNKGIQITIDHFLKRITIFKRKDDSKIGLNNMIINGFEVSNYNNNFELTRLAAMIYIYEMELKNG